MIRAIEFRNPERIPLDFPGYGDNDIINLHCHLPQGQRHDNKVDEWGCTWKCIDNKTMGQVVKPPLADWRNFTHYSFPDPLSRGRFEEAETCILTSQDKYFLGWSGSLFERMHYLRALKTLLEDLYLNPARVELLAEKVLVFLIQIVRGYSRIGADGVAFTDDWGTQTGLMIRPQMWREIFKPRYKKLFNVTHKSGMHVFLHSDGQIYEIIPDLIECGVDVLEIAQPELLGIENLGRDFGGKVCFFGAVDKQKTLIKGDEEAIKEEVRKLIDNLGRFQGGFIAKGDMEDFDDLGISKGKIKIMCEVFRELGRY